MLRRLAILVLLGLVAGCSKRERLNPFDPDNPTTRGRPLGFEAVAGDGIVTLRWTPVSANGLVGFRAYRRVGSETEFRPITSLLPTTADHIQDFGLANGVEHHYRLYYAFTDGLGSDPAEDAAIPGPLRPWFTDLSLARLIRITPDGRHVATQETVFRGPTQLAVNARNGVVWVCDPFASMVVILNPSNGLRFENRGFSSPSSVAIDPTDGTAWIADGDQNAVRHLNENGTPASPADLGQVLDPISVAVDPRDGSIWVCESSGNTVRRFTPDGAPEWGLPMTRPSRVDVDSLTGNGWVTSFQQGVVQRFTLSGTQGTPIGGFAGPIGIAVDPRRGRIWVADALAGQVVALSRGGQREFTVGGLSQAREIAVDRLTGDAWVTVTGSSEVARIDTLGTVRARIKGFVQPYAIALDPGERTLLAGPPAARSGIEAAARRGPSRRR